VAEPRGIGEDPESAFRRSLEIMLAVITSELGASFVTKHVDGICPGETVAVARYGGHPLEGFELNHSCPVFRLDEWQRRWGVRLKRRLGIPETALRDRALKAFLHRHRVTVVLGQYLDQMADYAPLLERMGLTYVVQGHGIDVSRYLLDDQMVKRIRALRSAKAILTRCEFHRKRLLNLGFDEEKVFVNPGGVDVPEVMEAKPRGANKRLLAVSRMAGKKGPIYLLEAFRRAAKSDSELRLDFVGGGGLFPAVKQFVSAMNMDDRVTLHGVAPEEVKMRLLRECGIFIQHSITDPDTGDEEGLPAAIQEAMAHGLAVVSTRHSGIPEAVVESKTGILVDEFDIAGMSAGILRCTGFADDYGRAGHLRAKELYTWRGERDRLRTWLGV